MSLCACPAATTGLRHQSLKVSSSYQRSQRQPSRRQRQQRQRQRKQQQQQKQRRQQRQRLQARQSQAQQSQGSSDGSRWFQEQVRAKILGVFESWALLALALPALCAPAWNEAAA